MSAHWKGGVTKTKQERIDLHDPPGGQCVLPILILILCHSSSLVICSSLSRSQFPNFRLLISFSVYQNGKRNVGPSTPFKMKMEMKVSGNTHHRTITNSNCIRQPVQFHHNQSPSSAAQKFSSHLNFTVISSQSLISIKQSFSHRNHITHSISAQAAVITSRFPRETRKYSYQGLNSDR